MQETDSGRRQSSKAWPIAVTVIAITAILATVAYLVFATLARIPEAASRQTREVLAAAQDLAAAFRQGTIETRFVSYATTVSGSTFLQIATLDRIEVFTREDRASIFWGAVQLPDVVVSATAPVQYTAYVDLDDSWHLQLADQTLRVVAPPIQFNRPAIDASQIEFEVRTGSLLRDEEAAMAELKRGLTSMSNLRTRELEPLVRETARDKIEDFVRTWLLQSFPDAVDVHIDVVFEGEDEPTPTILQVPDER